jgi:hypothetical protein
MKSAIRTKLALLLGLTLLSACAQPESSSLFAADASCPPPPQNILGERAMLRYHACLGSLNAQQLAAEYAEVSRHFSRTASGADRVKLAMLLSVPDTRFFSLTGAQQMLATSPKEGEPVPAMLRDLAQLLRADLTRAQALDDKTHALEKELAAEKQRADALRAKIDSVKDLERTMTEREAP